MKNGRDVMWVLPGHTDSSLQLMTKVLRKHNLKYVTFYLTYNLKLMESFGLPLKIFETKLGYSRV